MSDGPTVELLAVTPEPERLIEAAGRTCYLSLDKTGEDTAARFSRMLLRSGHHSVFEHASATFRVRGGSRAFTHQLVRHRLCAFSQQSQRYVDERGFGVVKPDSIAGNPEAEKIFNEHIAHSHEAYDRLRRLCGIPKEDARFVLPNAAESEIVITANFREWRYILELRGDHAAQWEIRRFAVEVFKVLVGHAPNVFGDFRLSGDGMCLEKVDLIAQHERRTRKGKLRRDSPGDD
ncbi:MAG TPA: FAD-dependent thymidylate synthase [bacterium]|nr:FAD-dependent thymidylate synthase [bacterium]